jgi:hypothetical protein
MRYDTYIYTTVVPPKSLDALNGFQTTKLILTARDGSDQPLRQTEYTGSYKRGFLRAVK